MKMTINGMFCENKAKTNKETGEVTNYAIFYNDEDIIRVKGLIIDETKTKKGSPMEGIPVDMNLFNGKAYFSYNVD